MISITFNYILKLANTYQNLIIFFVFILSFLESLAIISLILPSTLILISISVLINNNGVAFFPIWFATVIGAFLGDWLSYWIGYHYKKKIILIWNKFFSESFFKKGYLFFNRWGKYSIFIGRFFGPFRAIIPMIAGIYTMPKHFFQIFNLLSAMIWALIILTPGSFLTHLIM
ncbi:MAG: DedA family protein [Arsenophonus sp.]|nr:MAG: DedA family protein [Arsenophonus sp.]